jgi:transposase
MKAINIFTRFMRSQRAIAELFKVSPQLVHYWSKNDMPIGYKILAAHHMKVKPSSLDPELSALDKPGWLSD